MHKARPDESTRQKAVFIALLTIVFIAIVGGLFLGGTGDEDKAQPPGETTTTTRPPLVDDGPYQDEIARALRRAGFESKKDWDSDWDEVGLVTEVGEKSLKVMAPTEFVFLTSGDGDSECYKPIPITDMGSPGDIVGWSNEGEDSTVCDGEFALLWDAPKEPAPQA